MNQNQRMCRRVLSLIWDTRVPGERDRVVVYK
jgi:hypothetical protein